MRYQLIDARIRVEGVKVPDVLNSSETNRSRFYSPGLDALRFLAFSLVLLYHYLPHSAEQWSRALPVKLAAGVEILVEVFSFGLSLFFTLSAFLILELLLREREATGTIQIRQFYLRRILRICPLYILGLAIAVLLALQPAVDKGTIRWVGWCLVLLGNWYVVFFGDPNTSMYPLWSISVEEQFYLFAPWIVKRLSRRSLVGFSVVLILVANAVLVFAGIWGAQIVAPWYNSFVQFENFAAGILLCLLIRHRSIRMSMWRRMTAIGAATLCWFLACFWLSRISGESIMNGVLFVCSFALISLGCCLMVFAFTQLESGAVPGFLIYLGRISYGLYVFHALSKDITFQNKSDRSLAGMAIREVLALGLTLVLAAISYRFLEKPFLRLKKRHEIVESRPL